MEKSLSKMKLEMIISLIVICISVSCNNENDLGNMSVNEINIGDIDSNQIIIDINLISGLDKIEKELFDIDTCCGYSDEFTLFLSEKNNVKINSRIYRGCVIEQLPVGVSRYKGKQTVTVISNDTLHYSDFKVGVNNSEKIFSKFFKTDRFDDYLYIFFAGKKTQEVDIKLVTTSLVNGYLKFISDANNVKTDDFTFKMIFMLDSYDYKFNLPPPIIG